MSLFIDRKEEIKRVCEESDRPTLLNIFGEAGIGKTALKEEVKKHRSPQTIFFEIDLSEFVTRSSLSYLQICEAIVDRLIEQAKPHITGTLPRDLEDKAAVLTVKLVQLSEKAPTYLFVDTTETMQDNLQFWGWIEKNIASGLAMDGRIHQVYLGRLPVPWRRFELRRIAHLMQLEPLAVAKDGRSLVVACLQEREETRHLALPRLDAVVKAIVELTQGHPELTIAVTASATLMQAVTNIESGLDRHALQVELCRDVVEPYVKQHFFNVDSPFWSRILWDMSVLRWFDPIILQRFAKALMRDLAPAENDQYFYIDGIGKLVVQNTVVWYAEQGYQLSGLIAGIARTCYRLLYPKAYESALDAAAQTFRDLAEESEKIAGDDQVDARNFYAEAEQYKNPELAKEAIA